MAILIFFVLHWQLSVFFQSFFQHRYGAHRQFEMTPRMERVFHVLTYLVQGSSYLSPRAYAIMHRMHHAYSDTPNDPHTPWEYGNAFTMMWATKQRYSALVNRTETPEARFDGGYPEWDALDRFGDSWASRLLWGTAITLIYLKFATSPWLFLLLPFHWLLGPVHGAIVNWCGHKYGYRNFDLGDRSRNSLIVDFLCAGELFQNNHHSFGQSPNFAARWFEVDPTYQVMRLLHALRLIDMSKATLIPKHRLKSLGATEA